MDKDIPKQESIFEKGEIQSVVFDLDDTLFLTSKYYAKEIEEVAEYILRITGDTHNTTQTIYSRVAQMHKEIGRPMLLNLLIQKTLSSIYGEEMRNRKEIYQYIDQRVVGFYNNVPELRPHTLPVLEMIDSKGIPIAVYSHAQNEWTKKKTEYIRNRFLDIYGRELILPFYSTPLDGEKDLQGWKSAFEVFRFNPDSTLVVGDNLKSDILPAQALGVKNLILLNSRYSSNSIVENENGITRIEDIEEILEL